jgi:hypothetical protein
MFHNLPYNQEKTILILQKLELSEHTRELIKLSFRTRVKLTPEETISVQFRILPEKISPQQEARLPAVREEIVTQLKTHYPQESVEVVFQVAPCCGSECFGCRQFFR